MGAWRWVDVVGDDVEICVRDGDYACYLDWIGWMVRTISINHDNMSLWRVEVVRLEGGGRDGEKRRMVWEAMLLMMMEWLWNSDVIKMARFEFLINHFNRPIQSFQVRYLFINCSTCVPILGEWVYLMNGYVKFRIKDCQNQYWWGQLVIIPQLFLHNINTLVRQWSESTVW